MKIHPLVAAVFAASLSFVLYCTTVSPDDHPLDPNNPNYKPPSMTFDSLALSENDTVVSNTIVLVLTGNYEANVFRWRIMQDGDTTDWSAWGGKGEWDYTITISDLNTGSQALHLQTSYSPENGDITDSVITFVKVSAPKIAAFSEIAGPVTGGAQCTLWVEALGSEPLSYQWYRGAMELSDANKDTLVTAAYGSDGMAFYRCVVTNAWGADTAGISFSVAASAVPAPTNVAVVAEGDQFLRIVWTGVESAERYKIYRAVSLDDTPVAIGSAEGMDTKFFTEKGEYYFWVTAVRGGEESPYSEPAFSGENSLKTIRFIEDTVDIAIDDGGDTSYSLVAVVERFVDKPITFELDGCGEGMSAADSGVVVDGAVMAIGQTWCIVLVRQDEAVDSAVLSVTIRAVPPVAIMIDPGVRSFFEGESTTLSVSATGSAPLGYQWLKDGQPLSGALGSELALNALSVAESGVYSCVVSNEAGTDTTENKVRIEVRSNDIPDAPADLVVSERTETSLSLSWAAVQDIQYYIVYRSESVAFETYDSVGTTTDLSWSTTDVGEYFYGVSAYDGSKESFLSNIVDGGPPNRAPRWSSDTIRIETNVGETFHLSLADSCSDPDDDTLSFSLVDPVDKVTVSPEGALTVSAISAAVIRWAVVKVSDGELSADVIMRIQVIQPNRAPEFNNEFMPVSVQEGDSIDIHLADSCSDPDGDAISYTILSNQPRIKNLAGANYRFVAGIRDAGNYNIKIKAFDGELADTITVRVTVSERYHTVNISSQYGSVNVSPTAANNSYRFGDTLTLTAEADEGYKFDSWGGAVGGSESSITLVVDEDKNVTATFVEIGADECRVPELGSSLNVMIKSISAQGQGTICPEPGLYESGTVEVHGKVRILIR
ncbi:MAG: hypothetical protein GF344_16370 [Chitinivibrionales bacterium]|nr:hypothetical protein [Chitinivibrionales bacterium]MBD3358273.1 hypothetical protein [Chitinivibrionales bacterium]